MHTFKKAFHLKQSSIYVTILRPLFTVGRVLICSLLDINGASFLDIAFDILSVNFGCSGDIAVSSAGAEGTRLLPRVDLTESFEVA